MNIRVKISQLTDAILIVVMLLEWWRGVSWEQDEQVGSARSRGREEKEEMPRIQEKKIPFMALRLHLLRVIW